MLPNSIFPIFLNICPIFAYETRNVILALSKVQIRPHHMALNRLMIHKSYPSLPISPSRSNVVATLNVLHQLIHLGKILGLHYQEKVIFSKDMIKIQYSLFPFEKGIDQFLLAGHDLHHSYTYNHSISLYRI